MDVKEFIKEAILQIAKAVSEANAEFDRLKLDAQANPVGATVRSSSGTTPVGLSDTHDISFDIAVTASQTAEGSVSGGGDLTVAGFFKAAAGRESTSSTTDSHVSRIQFVIPLRIPQGKAGDLKW